ncbi:MAG: DUF2911 domain-containing protein [Bacteroidota bacterium]
MIFTKQFLVVFLMFSTVAFAQIKTPDASPKATVNQSVGLSEVSVEYARPSAKKRTVFGDLIPFDANWRTGANMNTTVHFSDDVEVNGNYLDKGKYALYTKPGKKSWTIYFYEDTNNWGLPKNWDENKVAAAFEVKAKSSDLRFETFSILFDDVNPYDVKMILAWENTLVDFTIAFPTDDKVMENIESVMNGPSANDYYAAAVYYLNADKDINQAKDWIDKAMNMMDEKPYYMLRQQALIYAKAGHKKQAVKIAKQSLDAAKNAGNQEYVKMNKASIEKWTK